MVRQCRFRRKHRTSKIPIVKKKSTDSGSRSEDAGKQFSFKASEFRLSQSQSLSGSPKVARFNSPPSSEIQEVPTDPVLLDQNAPVFNSPPIPEQCDDFSVPPPPAMNKPNLVVGSHPIPISSSSPSPRKTPSVNQKGKEPMVSPTPYNSPSDSPINRADSDIDFLLQQNPSLLEPLTVHKPSFLTISPNSARNITTRKKHKGGSRHFRGRPTASDLRVSNLSLVDVPILEPPASQPLRASSAGRPSK